MQGPIYISTSVNSSGQDIHIQPLGSGFFVQAATGVSIVSAAGSIVHQQGSTSTSMAGSSYTITSPAVTIASPALTASDSTSGATLFQSLTQTQPTCASPGVTNFTYNTARSTLRVGPSSDVVLNVGTGIWGLGGSVQLNGVTLTCSGLIQTAGGLPLQLMNGPTDVIDVRGVISNGALFGQVTFVDLNGVDFQSTPLHDASGRSLYIDDIKGLTILNTYLNSSLYADRWRANPGGGSTIDIYPNAGVVIHGNLNVTGAVTPPAAAARPTRASSATWWT